MTTNASVQKIIDEFVTELTSAIREQTLAALAQALGSAPRAAKGGQARGVQATAGSPRAASRAKGAKRAPEELEQLTEKLAAYIAKNPGQRIEQIAVGMGTSTKELTLPARKLLAEKALKTKGQRRATQYFSK